MKNITEILELFVSNLGKYNQLVEKDIIELLQNKGAYYLLEYDYEWFIISAWAMSAKGEYISKCTDIPSQKMEKYFPSDAFVDEDIHFEDNLYEEGLEEDEIDSCLEKYDQEKNAIFSKWFQQRWENALKNAHIQADGYFSPHDSYFYTDLNTEKTINEDQIKAKYQ